MTRSLPHTNRFAQLVAAYRQPALEKDRAVREQAPR